MATLSLLACLGCNDKEPASVDSTPPKTPIEEGVRRFVEWFREYKGQRST